MPIDLNSSVRACSQLVFKTDTLNNVLKSSILVAILITFSMVILVMIFYPAKFNTPLSAVFRMGIYMFFVTLLIVFLHDSVIQQTNDEQLITDVHVDMMRGVSNNGKNPVYSYDSVKPTLNSPRNVPENPVTGANEPADVYGGSIVNESFGALGGSYAPTNGGNPYK